MKIKVVNKSKYPLPSYATEGSSGIDLFADIAEDITVKMGEVALIPTGIHVQVPEGCEAQVRARSGLSLKHGLFLVNGIGTIDSDYTGEIKIIMSNAKKEPFTVKPGMKIAQLVFARYEKAELISVENLDETKRGQGGFGHSGI